MSGKSLLSEWVNITRFPGFSQNTVLVFIAQTEPVWNTKDLVQRKIFEESKRFHRKR